MVSARTGTRIPLPQPVTRKGVNSQPPVGLGLEYKLSGGESALRAAARRASGQRREDARSSLPCTQTPRPIASSSCEILALQRGRSEFAQNSRPAKGEHTRLDQRPASASQPPLPPCKCHPFVHRAFDSSFLGKLTLPLLPATSTCSQTPTKKGGWYGCVGKCDAGFKSSTRQSEPPRLPSQLGMITGSFSELVR